MEYFSYSRLNKVLKFKQLWAKQIFFRIRNYLILSRSIVSLSLSLSLRINYLEYFFYWIISFCISRIFLFVESLLALSFVFIVGLSYSFYFFSPLKTNCREGKNNKYEITWPRIMLLTDFNCYYSKGKWNRIFYIKGFKDPILLGISISSASFVRRTYFIEKTYMN